MNSKEYGFIAEYIIETTCNHYLTEPGTISSPNYPDNYPDDAECQYRLTAPTGLNVELVIQDMAIEYVDWDYYSISSHFWDSYSYYDFPGCPFDYLSVYDGPEADESRLIDVFCGSMDDVPEPVIRSSGQHIYLEFKSDSSVNYRGFQATFTFFEDIPTTSPDYPPDPPEDRVDPLWIYVGVGLGVLLLVICGIGGVVYKKQQKTKSSIGTRDTNNKSFSSHVNPGMELDNQYYQ
ncbi:tolloid-like protein 2 [Amphiura filiformis]|uniref:tolloid-like protein 2 n=1 Tax=Amphiura filiformis TaxID=82378 RepID=UPI003B21BEAD